MKIEFAPLCCFSPYEISSCSQATRVTFLALGSILTLGAIGLVIRNSGSISPELDTIIRPSFVIGILLTSIGLCIASTSSDDEIKTNTSSSLQSEYEQVPTFDPQDYPFDD